VVGPHGGEVVDGGPGPVGDDGREQPRPPGDQPGQSVVVELPVAVGAFGDPSVTQTARRPDVARA